MLVGTYIIDFILFSLQHSPNFLDWYNTNDKNEGSTVILVLTSEDFRARPFFY